jgi:quinol monooxygenase YgiN
VSQSVKIVAILEAKPGQEQALEQLLNGMTGPSRAEAGNLRYDLWRDPQEPKRFVLDELYVDDAAVASHRATAHFQDYLSRISALASRTAFVLHPANLAD